MQTVAKSTREQQRDNAAYAALIVAQSDGCQVEYQDRAQDDFVRLWAIPGPESIELSNDGEIQEEVTRKYFDIPRQYGCSCGRADCPRAGAYTGHDSVLLFPPKHRPSVNAVIRFEDRSFSVKNPECDSLGAKYKLHSEYHKPRGTSQL